MMFIITPTVNSSAVIVIAPMRHFKNILLLLILMLIIYSAKSAAPPVRAIVQCVCPRQTTSIRPYSNAPKRYINEYSRAFVKKITVNILYARAFYMLCVWKKFFLYATIIKYRDSDDCLPERASLKTAFVGTLLA